MEHENFDQLTRSMAHVVGARRQALHALGVILLGGALSGIVTRLGLTEDAEAKGKRHKAQSKPKRKPQVERKTQGAVQAEGKGKKKGKGRKKPKAPPCDELKPVLCGACERPLCVAGDWICVSNGEKDCGGGVCVGADECCDNLTPLCTDCHEPFCDNGIWTCRNDTKQKCADGTCVPFTECCPDRKRCPGGDGRCIPKDNCCPGEKPCDDGSCVPSNQCCPITQHGCHGCQEPFCDNGIWGCRLKCDGTEYCCGPQCVPLQECCGEPPDCGPCGDLECAGGPGGWWCRPKACCPPGYRSCPANTEIYGGCCHPDDYHILDGRPFCRSQHCDI